MTRMMRSVALLALLPMTSLFGQSWCGCGEFSAGADLLIWTHTDDNYAYAEKVDNRLDNQDNAGGSVPPPSINVSIGDVTREYVKVGYEPGVRIHGRYDTDCGYLRLSYLWLELKDSRTTHSLPFQFGPQLGPQNPPGETQLLTSNPFFSRASQATSMSGTVRSRYQNIDLAAGRLLKSNCWGNVTAYGNFRWVDIDHRRSTAAFIPETFNFRVPPPFPLVPSDGGPDFAYRWDTTFWGAGLGAGLSFESNLCCGLSTTGRLGVMGLVGEQQLRASGDLFQDFLGLQTRTAATLDVPSRTCFVPGLDFGLGLAYSWECDCFALGIELAYEVHYYPHALSWRGGFNQPSIAADQYVVGNIGYGGPSLQFTLGY